MHASDGYAGSITKYTRIAYESAPALPFSHTAFCIGICPQLKQNAAGSCMASIGSIMERGPGVLRSCDRWIF